MKIFLIALITSLLDIATKWYTRSRFPDVSLLGDWIELTYVQNTGIAFSIPLPGIYFIVPAILVGLLVLLLYFWDTLSGNEKKAYILIITGGLLNAIERGIFGYVTDMISVKYFAVFNVADIAVTTGVLLLIGSNFLSRKKHIKKLQKSKK